MKHLALLALVLSSVSLAEVPAGPTVFLPLDRYEQLAARREPRSTTVVESVRLEGSFEKGLFLRLQGRATGEMPSVAVLSAEGLRLSACGPEALLSISPSGEEVMLTPLQPKFAVRCALGVPESSTFRVTVRGVLDVDGSISDGPVTIGEAAAGLRTLVATRTFERTEKVAEVGRPVSAVGRYRITVLPDETRFLWQLALHNPNRQPKTFSVSARPGELLGEVQTTLVHQLSGGELTVEVPPGEAELGISGTLQGTEFQPPLEAAIQMVLVESHPLLRTELLTASKRVGVSQAGLSSQFRGAQAFMLAKAERLGWKSTQLETLPSTSYAVRSLASTFFVSADGEAVGQSDIFLQNQGAADLALPLGATLAFAAVGNEPTVMTKNAQGDLWLPLSPGAQQITLQYRQKLETGFGFATGELQLPGLGESASTAQLEFRYGKDWFPLFESFIGERNLALPDFGEFLVVVLFVLWAERLLAALGLSRQHRVPFALLLGVLAGTRHAAHWPVVFALGCGSMLWVLRWLRSLRLGRLLPSVSGLMSLGVMLTIGALMMVGVVTLLGDNVRRLFGASADALAGNDSVFSGRQRTTAAPGAPAEVPPQDLYRGLPARLELPSGTRHGYLSRELADTRRPTVARVLLVSSAIVDGLQALLTLAALGMAFGWRARLIAGVQAQLLHLTQSEEPQVQPKAA